MDFRRLFDLLHYQQARFPNKAALLERGHMEWQAWSTEACIQRMDELSAALLELGLNRGDRAGIYAGGGSPDWILLDLALQQIGIVVVPMHAGLHDGELEYMLKASGVRACFTSDREGYEHLDEMRPQVHSLEFLFTFRSLPDLPSLEEHIRIPSPEHLEYIQTLRAGIHEDDLVTILFTSGTSGQPKGVCLSHKNIISNLKSIIAIVPVSCHKRVISFLPLSHIFERVVVYTYLAVGASVYFAERPGQLLANLKEVRPHYLSVVPLVLERFYEDIHRYARQKGGVRQRLIEWAVELGKKYNGRFRIAPWYWFKLLVADLIVYRRWRRQLGGKLEGIVSGAAALRPELARLFSAAGLEVREGYGLTEASPVVSCNRFEPGGFRFGTAGIPIPSVQVRIVEGEGQEGTGIIEVKGPNVMLGYLDDEEGTREVISEEGWLHTGDIGYLEDRRFLHVIGRGSNVFKTASGQFVSVRRIEQQLERSPFVEQAMVMGRNQPWLGALVVPDMEHLQTWCIQHEVHWTAPEYMIFNTLVLQHFEEVIDELNKHLPLYERVKSFQLVAEPWSVENGTMTPTMKLRRAVIEEMYTKARERLFPET